MPETESLLPDRPLSPRLEDDIMEEAAIQYVEEHHQSKGMHYSTYGSSEIPSEETVEDEPEEMRWMREHLSQSKNLPFMRRPSVAIVCISIFLLAFTGALGISATVDLLLQKICQSLKSQENVSTHNYLNPDGSCNAGEVQKVASRIQSLSSIFVGLVPTLLAGKIGLSSDMYGRKPMFILNSFFVAISKILSVLVISPLVPLKMWYQVLPAFIEVLGGGTLVALSLANSYIIDVVDPAQRISCMGLMMASFYVGMSLGPLCGSAITSRFQDGGWMQLYTMCILCVIQLLFTILCLPESRSLLARKKSRTESIASQNSREMRMALLKSKRDYLKEAKTRITEIFASLKMFWITRRLSSGSIDTVARTNVLLIVVIDVLFSISGYAFAPIMLFYGVFKFQWTAVEMGYLITIMMATKAFVLLIVSPRLVPFLRRRIPLDHHSVDNIDKLLINGSLVLETIGAACVMLASTTTAYFLACILGALGASLQPTLHSSLAKHVPQSRTGEVFGAVALYKNLVVFVTPPFFLWLYSNTIEVHPLACFTLNLFAVGSSLLVSFFLRTEKDIQVIEE